MAHKVRTATGTTEFTNWDEAVEAAQAIWLAEGDFNAARLSPDHNGFDSLAGYLSALNADAYFAEAHPELEAWIGRLAEDLDFWAEMGVHTPEDMARSLAEECYHNVHKSVCGFRPREDLSRYTLEELDQKTHALAEMEPAD